MSAYGGGFIYLFQHYFSFDSMLKLDSRQHCTKTKRTSQWTETYPLTNKGGGPSYVIEYMKKYLNKFLETYKSKILFSGILKDHLTKYEHAVFYNIRGHYNEKTNGTTQQNTGEWNAAHTRSLKQAYVTQLPCQQRRTYEGQTGTT